MPHYPFSDHMHPKQLVDYEMEGLPVLATVFHGVCRESHAAQAYLSYTHTTHAHNKFQFHPHQLRLNDAIRQMQ